LDESEDIHIVQANSISNFCIAAGKAAGLPQEHSSILADTLVQADLRGVHSHGVARFPWYIKGFQFGEVNPLPSIRVTKDVGATAVVDGDNGLGLIVSYPAMRLAMDKAAKYGVGTVIVQKSNHYGMASYWSMMALERDMIGYTTTNGHPLLAPWGGITPSYSNNPISYAIPAGEEWPIVLDMSMSVGAMGKVRMAAVRNESLPQGWAMDKYGKPTTDPQVAIEGLLMPISGYKGYGLALVNDILSGVLSGGLFGTDIPKQKPDHYSAAGYCHFFMALDINHFMPVSEFKERVDRMVRMMKDSRLAQSYDRIYLPGEIEFETHHKRVRDGIPYSRETIDQLRNLAHDMHILQDLEPL